MRAGARPAAVDVGDAPVLVEGLEHDRVRRVPSPRTGGADEFVQGARRGHADHPNLVAAGCVISGLPSDSAAAALRLSGAGVDLRDAVRRDPALADRVRQTLRDLLPAVAESLTPPDREGTDWDALGASGEEIRAFALNGLTRRLSIVGVPLTSP